MSKINQALDQFIRIRANQHCEYCLNPQPLIPSKLEIEHIHPESLGGETIEENLCLACRECNGHKAAKIEGIDPLTGKSESLFNPRRQQWADHFDFSSDKLEISGITACGRATVECLRINSIYQITTRKYWVRANLFPPNFD